jgi:hypothetical protein
VAAVPYSPPAVIFPLPVFLRQQNSSISDCNTVTIAGLLYVPGGSANNPVLEFGIRPNGLSGPQPSFNKSSIKMVRNSANDSDGFGLTFCLMGSDIITDGFGNAFCHCLALGTSNTYLAGGSAGPKQTLRLSYDTWHKIFFSADVSVTTHGGETAPSSFTLTQGYTAYVFCDGLQVQLLPLAGANSTSAGWGPYQSAPTNQFPGFPDYTQDQSIFNYTSPPIPVSVFGQEIGVPIETIDAGLLVSPLVYSDLQIWYGTYIDPTGSYGGATRAKPTQANSQYGKVDPVLLGQLVDAAIAGGLDPLYVLTAMNIESAYGTQPGIFKNNPAEPNGIFQLNAEHINDALGTNLTTASQVQDNNNQMRAFVASNIQYANTAIPSYMDVAIQYFGSDPTGVYSYIGQLGSVNQTNALQALSSAPSTLIKNLPPPSNTELLGQAWSNDQSGITGNSTITAWFNSLNALWTSAGADAASRLQGTSNTNLNAFINQLGRPVPPIVAASVFGDQTLLFSGNARTFPVNGGSTESIEIFSLVNGPLIDFSPGP